MEKSQSGANAAILITVLSALIIIYIIFLPSDDRLDIIGENASETDEEDGENTLLEDSEIIMRFFKEDEIEYDLPSLNLYLKTGAETIVEENSIYVRNGIFEKEDKRIPFALDDPQNTQNILISFFAKKSTGRFIIKANEREIYNNHVEKVNVDPIRVPKDVIAKTNELVLEVSGVGAKFWTTNEYLLESFKITADVTDVSTTESSISLVVPPSEASNIEKATLRFVPECQPERVGLLEISINTREIFSAVPDCGSPRPIDFSPALLTSGENKIEFKTDKGRYLIDQIKVTTKLEDSPSYAYFFDVDADLLRDVRNKEKHVNLTFLFSDDKEDKEAEIIVNGGKRISMRRHDDFEWSDLLDTFLEEGRNSIKIEPKRRMEVRKLLVTVED